MKLYIAGPMTGHPQFNFPLFDRLATELRAVGHEIVSPTELDDPETRAAALASPDGAPGSDAAGNETWGDFLARDVKIIADEVEGVAAIPGWHTSRGARLEVFCCRLVDKPVFRIIEPRVESDGMGGETAIPIRLEPIQNDELDAELQHGDPGNNGHAVLGAESDAGTEALNPGPPLVIDAEGSTEPAPGDFLGKIRDEITQVYMAFGREPVRIEVSNPEKVDPPTLYGLPVVLNDSLEPGTFKIVTDRGLAEVAAEEQIAGREGETRVVDEETGGAKGQKPERWDLLPLLFLDELSKVYGFGAEKYADFNYTLGYDWKLSQGALLRHYKAWALGESYDRETGLHHLAHAAWHCATLFLFERYGLGSDRTLRAVLDGDYEPPVED